ncbi:MAG: ribosomal protein S18-alanine N-acetyltransferase [Mariprofundus sp.]|nr:ribosomal protein S18-alanine N-acetyltransferase [Mariprofundus sp.]
MLRQGNLEDIEAVYRLNRVNFSGYWSRESLFSALESGYDLLLCDIDGQSVAYLLSLSILDEVQIMQIAVCSDYRRQGMASRMTAALIGSAPSACTLTLEVRASNYAARKLYAGLGFKELGYRKNYYTPDTSGCCEDAIVMNLRCTESHSVLNLL